MNTKYSIAALAIALSVGLPSPRDAEASILGPGDIVNDRNDSAFDLIVLDLTNSASLGAGTYNADNFNYQFHTSSTALGGNITPLVAIGDGVGGYEVVALGSTITYAGDTGWTTVAFGGSDSFTLSSTTAIYGGLYWDGSTSLRMPVGHKLNGGPNTFIRYSSADAPVVGSSISGGTVGQFNRAYDFSIQVNAVPEPTTFLVWSVLGVTVWIGSKRSARSAA